MKNPKVDTCRNGGKKESKHDILIPLDLEYRIRQESSSKLFLKTKKYPHPYAAPVSGYQVFPSQRH